MSTSRTLLRSSRLFSRGCTTTRATRPACLSSPMSSSVRQLATSARLWQETIETPSRGKEVPLTAFTPAPSGTHARSIAILRLPPRASRSDIEAFLRGKGLDITNLQLRLDRFTFHNDKRCFIELASEEQAKKAIEILHDAEFMHNNIVVLPLKEDFVWGSGKDKVNGHLSRFFHENETSPSEALKPLLEGRRMLFSVQPPGWVETNSSIGHNKFATKVIEDHLGKYGIEAIGGLQPFYGDMKPHPRMLCFLDFTTKSGADQAVQAVHDTDIEGRKVWLRPSVLAPWRAHQVGKVDQALLAQLQEKGLASTEPYEDNFVKSDQKKGEKNYKTTRIQRVERKKTQ